MERGAKILLSMALVLGVVLVLASGVAYQSWVTIAYSSPDDGEHTLQVIGYGKVSVEPDRAKIYVLISSLNFSASEAASKVASTYDELCTKMNESGLDWEAKTLGYTIRPVYEYYDGHRYLKGYRAIHYLLITIMKQEDLGKEAGEVIDVVSSVGDNDVRSVKFTVGCDELKSLKDQALSQAMKDAKGRAELLANTGNFELIGLKSITISSYPSLPYRTEYEEYTYKAAVPTTVLAPSTMEITTSVTVTYAIMG